MRHFIGSLWIARWSASWAISITFVSSGEFLGPMQEMRMKFKHPGILARPEGLRNFVF